MSGVNLNPASGTAVLNVPQSDNLLAQPSGLDALLAQPSFTFEGADFNTSIYSPPGSPLLGINPLIPDSLENWWYGRTSLGDGGAYVQKNGFYFLFDKKGDFVGKFKEVKEGEHTRSITTGSDGSKSLTIVGQGASVGGSSTSMTVYLAPAK